LKSGGKLDDRGEPRVFSSELGQTVRVARRGRIGE
jgi:hypothetical protein